MFNHSVFVYFIFLRRFITYLLVLNFYLQCSKITNSSSDLVVTYSLGRNNSVFEFSQKTFDEQLREILNKNYV